MLLKQRNRSNKRQSLLNRVIEMGNERSHLYEPIKFQHFNATKLCVQLEQKLTCVHTLQNPQILYSGSSYKVKI